MDIGYRFNNWIISLLLRYFFILLDLNFFQYWNEFFFFIFFIFHL